MSTRSFIPQPKTLMGPGPSNMDSRVLEAMSRPVIGHLDPDFVNLMNDVKDLLRFAFMTSNALTFPVSAPGSAGMETSFVNLIESGDDVIVCVNGVFGERMCENVLRCGGNVHRVDDEWGKPIDLDKLENQLVKTPGAKAVAFVHAETSTGVASDAKAIAKLAAQHDCLSIMDAVTSLAGIPIRLDEWGIDAVYSGTQKCLSCAPGLSPVSFSERAMSAIKRRKTRVQSWFLDLTLVVDYWAEGSTAGRSYHHTAPVNAIYGLHESLLILNEEGLEQSWERHQRMHDQLCAGLEVLGIEYLVSPDARLPQLNTVIIPEDLKNVEAQIRKSLLLDHQLEIGGGLGALAGKVWRIGLMGHGASTKNVNHCLGAMEQVLSDFRSGRVNAHQQAEQSITT